MNNVHVWIGRQPTGYEAEALRKLRHSLSTMNGPCHLMANFIVGGTEIDLFAVKPDGLFLIELKKVQGPVTGAINGAWVIQNGKENHQLNGGRGKNPYQQMTGQFYALVNWLERHKTDFLSEYDAENVCFWRNRDDAKAGPRVDIQSLLTFYPELPAGSQLDLDWKVEAVGFTELPQILATQTTPLANFTPDAIVRLAKALNLRPWTTLQLTTGAGWGSGEDHGPELLPALHEALDRCWQYLQLTTLDVVIPRLAHRRHDLHRHLTAATRNVHDGGSLNGRRQEQVSIATRTE